MSNNNSSVKTITVAAGQTLTITSLSQVPQALVNNGVVIVAGSGTLAFGSIVNNGSLTLQTGTITASSVTNAGILNNQAWQTEPAFGTLTNTGTLLGNTIAVANGATIAGTFSDWLDINGGTSTIAASTVISNPDARINLNGGSLTLGNTWTNGEYTLKVYGGTLTLAAGGNLELESNSATIIRQTGSVYIVGNNTNAGDAILGSTAATTTLAIAGQGTATLNPADTNLTVIAYVNSTLNLGGATNLTILCDQTTNGYPSRENDDTIKGATASFNGTTLNNWGGNDVLDLTDLTYARLGAVQVSASNGYSKVTVSDGTHTANIQVQGTLDAGNLALTSDGHGGTLITEQARTTGTVTVAAGQTLVIASESQIPGTLINYGSVKVTGPVLTFGTIVNHGTFATAGGNDLFASSVTNDGLLNEYATSLSVSGTVTSTGTVLLPGSGLTIANGGNFSGILSEYYGTAGGVTFTGGNSVISAIPTAGNMSPGLGLTGGMLTVNSSVVSNSLSTSAGTINVTAGTHWKLSYWPDHFPGPVSGAGTIELGNSGTLTLNPQVSQITLQLDAATVVNLNGAGKMSFISDAAKDDTFIGTTASFNGDSFTGFGNGNRLDFTDLAFATVKPITVTASGSASLITVNDGAHSALFTLQDSTTSTGLAMTGDGHGGTVLSFLNA
jgi:hypothetical protein